MILRIFFENVLKKPKLAKTFALLLALIPPAFLAWFIYRFGVDVPFADQWDFVPLLDQMYSWRLTLQTLISQHNEHRLLFPKMIMLTLAYWSGWNVRWEMGVSYLIACATFVVLLFQAQQLYQALGSRLPVGLVFGISLLIFSIKQHANWLWGWQIAIFLNILAVVTGIFLLSYRPITWGRLLGAIACAVVATFSFGNGLLLWWIGLLMLTVPWLKNRQTSITFPLSWLLAGSLLTGVYLNDFRVPSHHPSPWTLLEQPIEYVQYMLSFLGNPISTQYSLLMGFLGLIGVGACLTLLVRRYAVQIEPLLPLIALFLYSVGSAALIGVGRLGFGVDQAGRSRYVTIANLCWIALIVLIALLFKVYRSRRPEGQTELAHSTYRRRRPYYLAGVVLLIVVASIFSVKTQLSSSRTNPLSLPDVHQFARRHMALTAARKELLILENDELLKQLHKNPRYLRHRIGILRTHGLSVFREEPGTGR